MLRSNTLLVATASALLVLLRPAEAFQAPATPVAGRPTALRAVGKRKEEEEPKWTYNPFDPDDLSPLDTLLRRGFVPFAVRISQNERWEEAVVRYMEKDGCDRATAQRNMDAYFNDPNGWVVRKQRERTMGEPPADVNRPTGVARRPVFSILWGSFTVWLFTTYFPNQIAAVGGIRPTGFCATEQVVVDGKKVCPQYTPNAFRSTDGQAFLNQVTIDEARK